MLLCKKKINEWSSGLRFINDMLVESSSGAGINEFISVDEMEEIKRWAGISGNPEFIGSGSRGAAYLFGSTVIKITNDESEAYACNNIVGKFHDNVYRVYMVGLRNRKYLDVSRYPGHKFVIACEFLDYPDMEMVNVCQHMKEVMYGSEDSGNIFYRWDEKYIDDTISIASQGISRVAEYIDDAGMDNKSKLLRMLDDIGTSKTEKEFFLQFWNLDFGFYSKAFRSEKDLKTHLMSVGSSDIDEYMNGIASGLTFLANNGIIFTDLKTSNIMQRNGFPVIIDIGYSRVLTKKAIETIG